MSSPPSRRGVLLFAHGARDPGWARPFEQVAQALRQRCPELAVQLAFLEFMAPTLPAAADALAAAGCEAVDVVPLFLGAGGHVRKDVPALVAQIRAAHPRLRLALHPAVGEMPQVIAAMADAAAALVSRETPP